MKSVKVAVSAAVSMAFRQMHREFEAVEDMKKEAVKVNEEMTRLRARVQTQHFAQDRLEQYRVCGSDLRNSSQLRVMQLEKTTMRLYSQDWNRDVCESVLCTRDGYHADGQGCTKTNCSYSRHHDNIASDLQQDLTVYVARDLSLLLAVSANNFDIASLMLQLLGLADMSRVSCEINVAVQSITNTRLRDHERHNDGSSCVDRLEKLIVWSFHVCTGKKLLPSHIWYQKKRNYIPYKMVKSPLWGNFFIS